MLDVAQPTVRATATSEPTPAERDAKTRNAVSLAWQSSSQLQRLSAARQGVLSPFRRIPPGKPACTRSCAPQEPRPVSSHPGSVPRPLSSPWSRQYDPGATARGRDVPLRRHGLKPALRQAVRLARNRNVIFYTFGPAEAPAFAGRGTGRDVKLRRGTFRAFRDRERPADRGSVLPGQDATRSAPCLRPSCPSSRSFWGSGCSARSGGM